MQHDIGNSAGDRARDDAGDGKWLTYDEPAVVRHISRRAAVRMTQRQRLRRQPGNDGHVRVWVPCDMLSPSQRASQHDDADVVAGDVAPAFEAALAAIRDAKDSEIATLRAVVEGLRENVARSVALIDGFRSERDQAQHIVADERGRADALRDRLDAAEAQLATAEAAAELARRHAQEAQEAAEALRRAEAERKARGLVARLRAAWRGE